MTADDIDAGLTGEMKEVRDTVHRFAAEVLRPASIELDAMHDPADTIAEGSVYWDVVKKYEQLGIGDSSRYGDDLTPSQRALLHSVVLEELSWGDVGLCISLELRDTIAPWAQGFGRTEAYEFFSARKDVGCLALTEPDHGSDTMAFTEPIFSDPSVRPGCRARREGKEWVINGQKAAWVSNGPVATAAALFCTLEDSKDGFKGGVAFLVPLELPGISRGKPLDKIGQRTLPQGELFFKDVRISEDLMLIEGPDAYPMVWEMVLTLANNSMGQQFVGVARAAYDYALAYAKERVQGGVPIIQHQSVKARLFKMFAQVEAARSLARRVAIAHENGGVPFQHAAASKVFCTQTAFEVASDAIQIFGGNGLCREYPIEKIFRDARASLIEDGENEVLGVMAGARL
ncbi:MAG: acyl-CoA/acyl-ACP dehydrogenase [Deltaproteobacteria bacterium]|nr:acyl-CoA/acyl-ACP dehydrogenase [Deltaproteobacteria bacterium]